MKTWIAHAFAVLGLPIFVGVTCLIGGAATWLGVMTVFVVMPALDWIVGDNLSTPTIPSSQKRRFRGLLYAYVPLHVTLFGLGVYLFCGGDDDWWSLAGAVSSIGVSAGAVGMVVAHELGHSTRRYEHGLSLVVFGLNGYGHFRLQHVVGHHPSVGTPEDPASAARGETIYAFLPRVLFQTWKHAWALGNRQMSRKGRSVLSLRSELMLVTVAQATVALSLILFLGWASLLFYVGD